jgi:hypothetical protein
MIFKSNIKSPNFVFGLFIFGWGEGNYSKHLMGKYHMILKAYESFVMGTSLPVSELTFVNNPREHSFQHRPI